MYAARNGRTRTLALFVAFNFPPASSLLFLRVRRTNTEGDGLCSTQLEPRAACRARALSRFRHGKGRTARRGVFPGLSVWRPRPHPPSSLAPNVQNGRGFRSNLLRPKSRKGAREGAKLWRCQRGHQQRPDWSVNIGQMADGP